MSKTSKIKIQFITFCLITILIFSSNSMFGQMMGGGGYGSNRGGVGSHRGGMRNSRPDGNYDAVKKIPLGEHGGEIKEVGKFKIEMVFDPLMKENPLTFFFTSKKGKLIKNKEVTGTVEISSQDNSPTYKEKLDPLGDDGFTAMLTNKTTPFLCKISFIIDGKEFSESFFNKGFSTRGK